MLSQICYNTPWTTTTKIGIGTTNPDKILHIAALDPDLYGCYDPALKISYYGYWQGLTANIWGYLAIQTGQNEQYSSFAQAGDFVLQSGHDFSPNTNAIQNLILTTKHPQGAIKFGTTPPLGSQDLESMVILNTGNVGIRRTMPYYMDIEAPNHLSVDHYLGISQLGDEYPDWDNVNIFDNSRFNCYHQKNNSNIWERKSYKGNHSTLIESSKLGTLSLEVSGQYSTGNTLTFIDPAGLPMGIKISNTGAGNNSYAGIGLGANIYPNNTTRVIISGWTNNGSASALNVLNTNPYPNNSLLFVRNDGNIGINQIAPTAKLHLSNGSVLFDGTTGTTPTSGTGTRFMWIPEKAAIRAGILNYDNGSLGDQWDNGNIGLYSVAFGNDCEAFGDGSISFGGMNTSNADYSSTIGRNNSTWGLCAMAFGLNNQSSGQASTAIGQSNISNGNYSTAIGEGNLSSATSSIAIGYQNTAYGDYSAAIGHTCTSYGICSIAMGYQNYSIGNYSTSYGKSNISFGDYSFTSGYYNKANQAYSTTIGTSNITDGTGMHSIALGFYNTVYGETSIAIGESCTASGFYTLAMGTHSSSDYSGIAIGDNCYSWGNGSIAMGQDAFAGYNFYQYSQRPKKNYAIAIGNGTEALGESSIAIGHSAYTFEENSFAFGNNVQAKNKGSFIIGDENYDNSNGDKCTYSNQDNQMTMRFLGNSNCDDAENACFRLITSIGKSTGTCNGMYLFHNGYGWLGYSDSTLKTNITRLNVDSILIKLCNVPISSWQWKPDSTYRDSVIVYDSLSYTWVGPMAQDFYREFPYGIPSNSLLSESVMRGITFAAVQGLKRITDSIEYRESNNWNKFGDSITSEQFIGTINNLPLVFKTNSNERMLIANNQMSFLSNGSSGDTAFKFFSDASSIPGVFMYYGISGWNTPSDRNLKDSFQDIDGNSILKSISRIPVTTWIYKKGISNARYIGPMAQDFYNEFKFGTDSLSINSIIFDGINLAGIKALIVKTDSLQYQIDNKVTKDDFKFLADSIFSETKILNNKFDSVITKNEFYSYKDSLKCLNDACSKIQKLENQINYLQNKLDSLELKLSDTTKKNQFLIPMIQNINFDDIILEQNNPNPFAEICQINYYIPSKYQGDVKLLLTDETGINKLNQIDLCLGKPCQITISAKDLISGVYIYGIELNGKFIKSKKMMVIK